MIKAAVIGTGNIGRREANQIMKRDDVELVAGCDCMEPVVQEYAAQYGCRAYTDVDSMLDQEAIDLVIVATTNAGHAENVMAAIEHGVPNVMCEKPLSMDVADAEKMTVLAEEHGTRTSMGFGWGIHNSERYILDLVKSGKLGELLNFYCHGYRGYGFWGHEFRRNADGSRRQHPAVVHPEISGGWTVHHGCHYVFWLSQLGGSAESAFGKVAKSSGDCPSEETVSGMVVFKSGVVGHFTDSLGSFRGHRCGIVGTKGTVLLVDPHNRNPEEDIEIRMRYEGQTEDEVVTMHYDPDDMTRLSQMLDAINADGPSPVPFRLGLENVQICRAVQESSRSGQVVPIASVGRS